MRTPKCYRCHAPGATREHVPPKSFFPEGLRSDLIVVPSCPRHNNDLSLDIEYVRLILTAAYQVNDVGQAHNQGPVSRSLDRSPALLHATFADLTPLTLFGQETAAFNINVARLDAVMSAIAYGVYHHHFKRHYYGRWRIVTTQTVSVSSSQRERHKVHKSQWNIREVLEGLRYVGASTGQPEVFSFAVYAEDFHQVVLRLVFYGGVVIHAVGIPFWRSR